MSRIADEITQVSVELEELTRRLSDGLIAIDAEAHRQRISLCQAVAVRRAGLAVRLFHLEAAISAADRVPEPDRREAPRPNASEIVLSLLSSRADPVPAREIDEAVTKAGLSRSAAEKTKKRFLDAGMIVRDKRLYALTPAGREHARWKEGS